MTDRSHHHDWRQDWDKPAMKAPEPVVVVPDLPINATLEIVYDGSASEPEPVVEVHEEPEAPVAEAETHE